MSAAIREALEPFAKVAKWLAVDVRDDSTEWPEYMAFATGGGPVPDMPTVGDLRRARAAFEAIPSEGTVKVGALERSNGEGGWTLPVPLLEAIQREAVEIEGWASTTPLEVIEAVSLVAERRVLACLAPTLSGEAEAGPVGEAVAFEFDELHIGFGGERSWHRRYSATNPSRRPDIRNVRPLYNRPVEEPGEVERLTRERDRWQFNATVHARENKQLTDERDAAEAALAETRERLEKLEAENAARLERAIRDAAISWCGEKGRETFPEDIAYFENNWRSLPGLRKHVALYLGHAALTSDAQEAGE